MTIEDLTALDEAIAEAEGLLSAAQWYWIQACIALGFDPNEVIAENVSKLQNRYPGGEFDVYHSENRRPGDL